MRDEEKALSWFGPIAPIGELSTEDAAERLRELGEDTLADELVASGARGEDERFGVGGLVGGIFNRFMRTTHICGFLPAYGDERILPVTKVEPAESLQGEQLKITLDGLHLAKYPGRGVHTLLFDFALQAQGSDGGIPVFHYNSKFSARDGETVPVRNFPLFYGLVPSAEGITFGFQTINVASSFDEGLLGFLDLDEFKGGLSLLGGITPVLSQISQMVASLTAWLAAQSRNAKVQEFRQGLDFKASRLGGGLAEGSYIVVQIPIEHQREWSWEDWTVDPSLVRLVRRTERTTLDYNHLMFGVHLLKA